MYQDASIAGSWNELVGRLDQSSALKRWALAEPALARLGSIEEFVGLTAAGAALERADAVLGALVRTASAYGGDDPDATLVLLHVLSAGVEILAADLADLTTDSVALVVGELTVRIRSFGTGPRGGRRERAFAANLLRDTRRAVLRELRPHCTPKRPDDVDVLVDPTNPTWVSEVLDSDLAGPGDDDDEPELHDVLLWAERTGLAAPIDLAALIEGERSRDRTKSAAGQLRIAAALGIHQSTLRSRRNRALAALRAASGDFQAWLAA